MLGSTAGERHVWRGIIKLNSVNKVIPGSTVSVLSLER